MKKSTKITSDFSEMDAFDQDARDGFSAVSGANAYYNRTHSKINYQHAWKWVLLITGIIGFFAFASLTIFMDDKNPKISKTNKEIVEIETIQIQDKSNIKQLPGKQQVRSFQLSNNFEAQKKDELKDNSIEIDIENLPIRKLQGIENEKFLEIAKANHKVTGQFIYFYKLKVLDYTKYRANATLYIKNGEDLSGINASKIDKNSVEYKEEFEQLNYVEVLNSATLDFSKEQYKSALVQYETILNVFPLDVNALFYGAICYRNFGNYTKSIDLLESLLLNKFDIFDEEALFYLAENYLRTKHVIKAKLYLEQIVSQKGFYAQRAKDELKRIKN